MNIGLTTFGLKSFEMQQYWLRPPDRGPRKAASYAHQSIPIVGNKVVADIPVPCPDLQAEEDGVLVVHELMVVLFRGAIAGGRSKCCRVLQLLVFSGEMHPSILPLFDM